MSDRTAVGGGRGIVEPSTLSASAVASAALALAVVAGLADGVGHLQPVALGVGAGATFVVAGLAANREDPIAVAAGSLAFVLATGLLGLAVATVGGSVFSELDLTMTTAELVADSWQGLALVVAGCAVGYGVALAVSPGASKSVLSSVFHLAVGIGVVLAVALVTAVTGRFLEGTEPVIRLLGGLSPVRDAVVAPPADTPPIGSFLLVAAVATLTLRSLLGRLPLAELVARERRDAVRHRIERERSRALRVGAVAGVIGGGLVLFPEPLLESITASAPTVVVDPLGEVTAAGGLRLLLVWLTGLSVAGVAAVALLERLRRETVDELVGWLAAGVGGVAILVGLDRVTLTEYVAELIAVLPEDDADTVVELVDHAGLTGIALVAATVVVLVIGLFALAGIGAHALGILPSGTAGATYAALGVGLAAVVTGLIAGPSIVTFLAVGAAVVVWDVGAFGSRLRVELGPTAPTRSVELLHVALTATVATVGAVGAHVLADVVRPGVEFSAAAVFALVGAVLLLSALRG